MLTCSDAYNSLLRLKQGHSIRPANDSTTTLPWEDYIFCIYVKAMQPSVYMPIPTFVPVSVSRLYDILSIYLPKIKDQSNLMMAISDACNILARLE